MPDVARFDDDNASWYTDSDRREQLRRLSAACRELADLFVRRESSTAAEYRGAAATVDVLRAGPLDQNVLNGIGRYVPAPPPWMHPTSPDYYAPRGQWEDAVVAARVAVDRALLELRSRGTYAD
jgi:hypothetical protein